MEAYIYQAALLCPYCARNVKRYIKHNRTRDTLPRDDSEYWPQGPYADGGGESDSPDHCDSCGCFLHNPLTGDGADYVAEAFREFRQDGRGAADVIAEWAAEYDYVPGARETAEQAAAVLARIGAETLLPRFEV